MAEICNWYLEQVHNFCRHVIWTDEVQITSNGILYEIYMGNADKYMEILENNLETVIDDMLS